MTTEQQKFWQKAFIALIKKDHSIIGAAQGADLAVKEFKKRTRMDFPPDLSEDFGKTFDEISRD